MLNWNEFSKAARKEVSRAGWKDHELENILASPVQPIRDVDSIGRPLPGSALASKHPDPTSYRRIPDIRRQIASDSNETDYVSYAKAALKFFDDQGPFLEENCLFIVTVRTNQSEYEFLYAAGSRKLCAQIIN